MWAFPFQIIEGLFDKKYDLALNESKLLNDSQILSESDSE
jgi:hypothetical protein